MDEFTEMMLQEADQVTPRNDCSLCRSDQCTCEEEYPHDEYNDWDY